MKITGHQERFLESVGNAGVSLIASHWAMGGHFFLKPCQVERFTESPEQFAADHYGVTLEHLLAWADFIKGQQCLGFTEDGARCTSIAPMGAQLEKPNDFHLVNPKCYCPMHSPDLQAENASQ